MPVLVDGDEPTVKGSGMDRATAGGLPGPPRVAVLAGRGRTAYWDCPGPPGAPTLVLLHGVTLTAEVNWSGVVPWLTSHYRVLAVDQCGPAPGGPFRLEDCADDVAELAGVLGIDRIIPVGYSMGGLVAQLLWRRHPALTAGLVLCATARNVSGSPWERSVAQLLPGVIATATWLPALHALGADVLGAGLLDTQTPPKARRWALAQMRRTPLLTALCAVQAVCEFSSHRWIGSVDVPTAVVLTRHDRVVPPSRQWKLAQAVPGCRVHEIDGGHGVFLDAPGVFASALLDACAHVCGVTTDDEPTGLAS